MIKNLLFDLGGVIMDIRREDCVAAFERLGMGDADAFFDPYTQTGPFGDLEEGKTSPDEFRAEMRPHIGTEVSDAQIDDALNHFLVGIPVRRLRELEELHGRYGMYLLSNTNPIMWNSKIDSEFRKDGHDRGYYFDGMVTSFASKAVKPGKKIFDDVVSLYGIRPEETLFFDDSPANVEAARRYGYQAVLVRPGDEFAELLGRVESEE